MRRESICIRGQPCTTKANTHVPWVTISVVANKHRGYVVSLRCHYFSKTFEYQSMVALKPTNHCLNQSRCFSKTFEYQSMVALKYTNHCLNQSRCFSKTFDAQSQWHKQILEVGGNYAMAAAQAPIKSLCANSYLHIYLKLLCKC